MKNGELPIWIVAKLLCENWNYSAVAPATERLPAARASIDTYASVARVSFEFETEHGSWFADSKPDIRYDWIVLNEKGERLNDELSG